MIGHYQLYLVNILLSINYIIKINK